MAFLSFSKTLRVKKIFKSSLLLVTSLDIHQRAECFDVFQFCVPGAPEGLAHHIVSDVVAEVDVQY